MSTQTTSTIDKQDEAYFPPEASAQRLPTLLCLGFVSEVGEAAISKSEYYVTVPVSISGLEAGRSTKTYFSTIPEWLTKGFNPATLDTRKKADGGNGTAFVYSKNIAGKNGLSLLQGVSGSKEKFGQLFGQLVRLPIPEGTDGPALEDIGETLKNFLLGNVGTDGEPQKFIYELKQQATDSGEVGEDGKKIWVLENRYNVQAYYEFNEANVKKQYARCAKDPERFKFTFSEGVPF